MNTAINRSQVGILTNKSGGAVAQGDVVIIDSSTAASFTTTTTGAFVNGLIGVVMEPDGIANDAAGMVAFGGYVPKVNLSGSASLGDLFKTHTVAKQAVRHAAPLVAGDFGIVLGTGTTPAAWLFGKVDQGGGTGGAPSSAKYVTTEADGTLSAEVIISGLAGSADIDGIGGGGFAHEFNSGASPLTWSAAVDTENVNSTVKGHLYIQDNGASETLGTLSYSPAGAFDLRCKMSLGSELGTSASLPACGLVVGDSAMNNRGMILFYFSGTNDRFQVDAYTFASSTYTQRGASNLGMGSTVYLRITRDGSNNLSFYWSSDGILWNLIATQALTFTAAKAGLRLAPASIVTNVAVDWIRGS